MDPARIAALREDVAAMVRQTQNRARQIDRVERDCDLVAGFVARENVEAVLRLQGLLADAGRDTQDLKGRLARLKQQLAEIERQR